MLKGKPPEYPLVATLGEWALFARYSSTGWSSVKLVSVRPVEHKANYWLGWRDGNLGGRDAVTLERYRPELAAEVRAVLCQLWRYL